MPATHELSVITPTHHGVHRLPQLFESLAAQDVTIPFEVIVVIDGRDDAVAELIDQWRDRLTLRTVEHEVAQGVAAALTAGFDAAEGAYLVRCDDDLTLPTHFLSGHLHHHDERTDVVVLSPTRDVFPDTPYARAYGRWANQKALHSAASRPAERRWSGVAACFSMHRDAWAQSGGFDPRFAYREDSEFGYRLFRAGFSFINATELAVDHRGPSTTAATRLPRSFVSGASMKLFRSVHPEALPHLEPSGAWGRLVETIARLNRTPRRYAALGKALDTALPLLPQPVARRIVAAFVEGAALAGERYGSTDLHAYRGQKDAELRVERARTPQGDAPTLG